jgi:hypothetical protein
VSPGQRSFLQPRRKINRVVQQAVSSRVTRQIGIRRRAPIRVKPANVHVKQADARVAVMFCPLASALPIFARQAAHVSRWAVDFIAARGT